MVAQPSPAAATKHTLYTRNNMAKCDIIPMSVWAHDAMTLWTCGDTERPLVTVTPMILVVCTHLSSAVSEGAENSMLILCTTYGKFTDWYNTWRDVQITPSSVIPKRCLAETWFAESHFTENYSSTSCCSSTISLFPMTCAVAETHFPESVVPEFLMNVKLAAIVILFLTNAVTP